MFVNNLSYAHLMSKRDNNKIIIMIKNNNKNKETVNMYVVSCLLSMYVFVCKRHNYLF